MASGTYVAMNRPAEFFESDNLTNATNFAIKHGLELFFVLHDAEPPREPPVADEPAPVVDDEPSAGNRKRSRKSRKRSVKS